MVVFYTKHLELFKNTHYKWSNERPLGSTQMYLFIFSHVSKISAYIDILIIQGYLYHIRNLIL